LTISNFQFVSDLGIKKSELSASEVTLNRLKTEFAEYDRKIESHTAKAEQVRKDKLHHEKQAKVLAEALSKLEVRDRQECVNELNEAQREQTRLDTLIQENIKKGKAIPSMTCPLGLDCKELTEDAKAGYRDSLLTEYKEMLGKKGEVAEYVAKHKSELDQIESCEVSKQELKRHEELIVQLQDRCNDIGASIENFKKSKDSSDNIMKDAVKGINKLQFEIRELETKLESIGDSLLE
jgi:chromosome segregation ATPase